VSKICKIKHKYLVFPENALNFIQVKINLKVKTFKSPLTFDLRFSQPQSMFRVDEYDKNSITFPLLVFCLEFSKGEFNKVLGESKKTGQEESPPESSERWKLNLEEREGRLYLCYEETINQLAGLVFTYRKVDSTHVWLVIASSEFRRRGVMKLMMSAVQRYEEKTGTRKILTVNTIPSKFPNMPSALSTLGFVHCATQQLTDDQSQTIEQYSYKKMV
jgi:hypothetical protein